MRRRALVCAALLLAACSAPRPKKVVLEEEYGSSDPRFRRGRESGGDKKDEDPPPPSGEDLRVASGGRWTRAKRAQRGGLKDDRLEEDREGAAAEEAPKPDAAAKAKSEPPPKPEEGEPRGARTASRPEEIRALPTSGQPRYFSPKSLKRGRRRFVIPASLAADGAEDPDAEAEPDMPDRRAGFSPPAEQALDDTVPEATVADPTALGSYHVQIATSPEFAKVRLDKIYGFMADIDLEGDMGAAGLDGGEYWLRWSIVDLLEFEHPYSRPQRLRYRRPGGAPSE